MSASSIVDLEVNGLNHSYLNHSDHDDHDDSSPHVDHTDDSVTPGPDHADSTGL